MSKPTTSELLGALRQLREAVICFASSSYYTNEVRQAATRALEETQACSTHDITASESFSRAWLITSIGQLLACAEQMPDDNERDANLVMLNRAWRSAYDLLTKLNETNEGQPK